MSLFESVIRSLSHLKVEVHRKFPKTESLRDCTYCSYLRTVAHDFVHDDVDDIVHVDCFLLYDNDDECV